MNKFLAIVIVGLLWCNAGFADIYEYKKCFVAKSKFVTMYDGQATMKYISNWNEAKSYYDSSVFTINSNQNTITKTLVHSKDYLSSKPKKDKIEQEIFQFNTFSGGIISATYAARKGSWPAKGPVVSELFFNIENDSIDEKYSYYSGNEVVITDTREWKCEEIAKSSSESEASGSSGTAFFINNKGNLLTNHHVVDECKVLKINYFDKEYEAQLISSDKNLDLALLKVDLNPKSYLNFSSNMLKKRQEITIAGYPLGKGLSDDLKINDGKISSLKGFENNTNEVTVDIAINPGNSGGPIVDESGNLVAVAVSGMSKEVTEGINFGIKSWAVANFLSVNDIQPNMSNKYSKMNDDKLNQLLEESTLFISCTY